MKEQTTLLVLAEPQTCCVTWTSVGFWTSSENAWENSPDYIRKIFKIFICVPEI